MFFVQRRTQVKLALLCLIPLCALLNRLFKRFPEQGESLYSSQLNKWFIQHLSRFFGNVFFSVFEWLVLIALITLVGYTLYRLYGLIRTKHKKSTYLVQSLLNIGVSLSIGLFIFTVFWGLNYNRIHFTTRYDFVKGAYQPEDLADLYAYLLDEAARIRPLLPENAAGVAVPLGDYDDIFERAQDGFTVVSPAFTTLGGRYGIVKPLISSPLFNYAGITGIYSPFTGEPNVNIAVPHITIPATTCHEMAHQRGYGFESECNFIAYITALAHPDPDFNYSALIMGISYVSNALAEADLDALMRLNDTMDRGVFHDLQAISTFWKQYEGKAQTVAEELNNAYLQSNGVEEGVASYGEMVDLLLDLYASYT